MFGRSMSGPGMDDLMREANIPKLETRFWVRGTSATSTLEGQWVVTRARKLGECPLIQ